MNSHRTEINNVLFTSGRGGISAGLILTALMLIGSVATADAQRVYGVASRTTVVHTNSGTVVHKTTAVAVRPAALPHGYIAVLPHGYRVVGGGIFMVGTVRYRATFYQGRTVYIRL